MVVTSRSTELTIIDELGRTKENHRLPYGSVLDKQDGADITAGELSLTGTRIHIQSLLK